MLTPHLRGWLKHCYNLKGCAWVIAHLVIMSVIVSGGVRSHLFDPDSFHHLHFDVMEHLFAF